MSSRSLSKQKLKEELGPVTDYGSTMVHWMQNRLPRWQGSYNGEVERPSYSYIVDVSPPHSTSMAVN